MSAPTYQFLSALPSQRLAMLDRGPVFASHALPTVVFFGVALARGSEYPPQADALED
jgi:hypothetical protein